MGTFKSCTALPYTRWILLAVLLLSVYAGRSLPQNWAWENGPLEWMQVVILAGGMLMCWRRARALSAAGEPQAARFWTWAAPAWLVLIGRELSWGRVLFPAGYDENGPYFTLLADLRFGYLVHPIVITLILLWLVNVIRYRLYKAPLRLILEKRFPAAELAITAVAFACSLYAAKYIRLPLMEECVETAAYLGLVATVVGMKLEYAKLYKRSAVLVRNARQPIL